jgi:hypothetical protein
MFRSWFRDTQGKIADRIDRHADRYQNAGDVANEQEARMAAESARNAATVEEAREIERDFNRGHGRDDS